MKIQTDEKKINKQTNRLNGQHSRPSDKRKKSTKIDRREDNWHAHMHSTATRETVDASPNCFGARLSWGKLWNATHEKRTKRTRER